MGAGDGLVAQLCWALCDLMDVAHQAPLSMGFSRQEYCSGLPFSSPGDLSHPGIESVSLVLCAGGFFTTEPPGKQKVEMVGRERLAALCQ